MRAALLVVALSGCGRVGFDALGESDGGTGTGSGSGSGSACGTGGASGCSSSFSALTNATVGRAGNGNLGNYANDLAGPCGGAAGSNYGVQFMVMQSGSYEFTIDAAFDTVLYAIEGQTCTGTSLGCNDAPGTGGDSLTLALTTGQRLVVVIDSNGACGPFTLNYRGL